MRISIQAPQKYDLQALTKHLRERLEDPNLAETYTGISTEKDLIHIELPSLEDITEAQENLLVELVQAYTYSPDWNLARKHRAKLFRELDSRVASVQRKVRLSQKRNKPQELNLAQSQLDALDAYGQALADITNGLDPENPLWPTPPWQE